MVELRGVNLQATAKLAGGETTCSVGRRAAGLSLEEGAGARRPFRWQGLTHGCSAASPCWGQPVAKNQEMRMLAGDRVGWYPGVAGSSGMVAGYAFGL